jgi:hypothetical protein
MKINAAFCYALTVSTVACSQGAADRSRRSVRHTFQAARVKPYHTTTSSITPALSSCSGCPWA